MLKSFVTKSLLCSLLICTFGFFCTQISTAKSPESILRGKTYSINSSVDSPDIKNPPDFFPLRSNLRRKVGSPFVASGPYLKIHGFVTSVTGVPLSKVIIKMWQPNYSGHYNHLTHKDDYKKHDIDFLGAGTVITNNLGYYEFTTIAPGRPEGREPHINFIIEHSTLDEPLYIELFFDGNKNYQDPIFKEMATRYKYLLTKKAFPIKGAKDSYELEFNIKLDVVDPHRSF